MRLVEKVITPHASLASLPGKPYSLRPLSSPLLRRLAYSEVNMIVTPIVSALAKSLPSGPERGFERQKRAETQKVDLK